MIFEISRSEISKIMCRLKDNLARSANKILFTQPTSKESFAAFGGRAFFWETRHFNDFAKRNR
jgi:hypothetical protein